MKKLISLITFAFTMFAVQTSALATSSHTVKKGETFWTIAKNYGVPVNHLMTANNTKHDQIWPGQTVKIPTNSISLEERKLLARLVEAEAKGEPYAGKVAVATVVLNRVESDIFPNTIKGVVYDKHQFTPVSNGEINKPASAESTRAVNEAVAFHGKGSGSLYFYNPKKTSNQWLRSKKVTVRIGEHIFAK
ncbi:cell wall hydrolase [Bacillus sp. 31A1R]|uniref:Cell wall hydrolase n=1 Tax=Robertmurraya mangrovi TaxID=3098077 RepID=A0ABU5IWU5_9BACI|nr:cell wall hydrolase [Bacillus sp. 31A1R]MDZ5471586.1 cell wall hydrolase [Bacillus sp. 31A1R]